MRSHFAVAAALRPLELHHRALRRVRNLPDGQTTVGVASQEVLHPLSVLGEDEILEDRRALEVLVRAVDADVELAEHERLSGVRRHLRLVVEVLALDDAVRRQLVEVRAAAVAPDADALR